MIDKRDVPSLSYRDAMRELDRVVGLLESSNLELEDSLEYYKYGVELLADLRKRLTDAQQQVNVLMGQLEASTEDSVTDTVLS